MLLRSLLAQLPASRILVVDGGSTDATVAEASRYCRVVTAPTGRAAQMNAGAAAAPEANILWFVHADSILPGGAVPLIRDVMKDPRTTGGCFRLKIAGKHPALRVCDRLGNRGVGPFKVSCGDHTLFVRREAFERIGGFPDWPLMEDAEAWRRLTRLGRMVQVRPFVGTSARRWEKHGPWRTTWLYSAIMARYVLGDSPDRLMRLYERISSR
jgi:rSAM/selenodomain-associated transferase 2